MGCLWGGGGQQSKQSRCIHSPLSKIGKFWHVQKAPMSDEHVVSADGGSGRLTLLRPQGPSGTRSLGVSG